MTHRLLEDFRGRMRYRPLPDDLDDEAWPAIDKLRENGKWLWVPPVISMLLFLSLLLALTILTNLTWFNPEPPLRSCGKSAAEARDFGCTYDLMMDSWLPPNCYDEELSLEFRGLHDWPMYRHKNMTERLTIEEVAERGQALVHTTIEYHYTHCLFALRKLHRAWSLGKDIEAEVAEVKHTDHCASFVASTGRRLETSEDAGGLGSLQKIGTKLPVAFPTCISTTKIPRRK